MQCRKISEKLVSRVCRTGFSRINKFSPPPPQLKFFDLNFKADLKSIFLWWRIISGWQGSILFLLARKKHTRTLFLYLKKHTQFQFFVRLQYKVSSNNSESHLDTAYLMTDGKYRQEPPTLTQKYSESSRVLVGWSDFFYL